MVLKTYNKADVNTSKLHKEVKDSGHVSGFAGIRYSNDVVGILGDSIVDEVALDTVVNLHVSLDLNDKKQKKTSEIDVRTGELILAGVPFEGKLFSMQEHSQTNWIALNSNAKDDLMTYPFRINTKDDEPFILADKAHVLSFYLNGVGFKLGIINSGYTLKDQINAATTPAEIDAIVDNR